MSSQHFVVAVQTIRLTVWRTEPGKPYAVLNLVPASQYLSQHSKITDIAEQVFRDLSQFDQ